MKNVFLVVAIAFIGRSEAFFRRGYGRGYAYGRPYSYGSYSYGPYSYGSYSYAPYPIVTTGGGYLIVNPGEPYTSGAVAGGGGGNDAPPSTPAPPPTEESMSPAGPPRACCRALTAECMACSQGISVQEYCISNPDTTGCDSNETATNPPTVEQEPGPVITTQGGATTLPAGTVSLKTARCSACCMLNRPVLLSCPRK